MSQHDMNIANQGFPAFRSDLNNALSAIQTTHSGTSRPTGAVAGQIWLDTTTASSPTLKYYDGTDDISLATLDHSANTVNWLDSTVSVTGLTTTATGTVLTLSDTANTSTVNLIIDNQKEVRFRETTGNGTNYIGLKAPASVSADLTFTLPVAPTANNQALISSTAGVMSFTPYTLPASDGTANQVLQTNGSGVVSFATPSSGGFSGATTTSSAVDITLTNTSTQVQEISMTAADKSVILPDATTLTTKGTPIYQITNSGTQPFYIKCNGGFILTKLTFGSSVSLTLINNSTSEGIWLNNPFTLFTSIGYTLFSTPATIATGTTGTPALLYQYFQNTNSVTTSKISTSSAIICYHKGTSNRDVYGVVVSYSGATITVNSETLLYSGSTTASTSSQVVMLDATNGLLFVTRASNNVVVPFTISGTTITAGTASATFGTGTGTGNQRQLGQAIAMDSTTALVPDRNSTSAATWTLRTIIHNGASAPTVGTASTAITTHDVLSFPYLSKIDATNAFACYRVATTFYTVARVITISGSSAPTLQTANTSSTSNIGAMIYPSKVSSTEFIVIGNSSMDRYTVSGTTVTYASNGTYTNTGQISGDNLNFVFSFNSGENVYIQPRGSNFNAFSGETGFNFSVFKKINNFYELCNGTELEKSLDLGTVFSGGISAAIDMVELDTDIILLITNNAGSSTISAIILKYKGI